MATGAIRRGKVMPILLLAPLLLVFCLATGCESQLPAYPADLPYPARTDPLVTEQIAEIPAKPRDTERDTPIGITEILRTLWLTSRCRLELDSPLSCLGRQRGNLAVRRIDN